MATTESADIEEIVKPLARRVDDVVLQNVVSNMLEEISNENIVSVENMNLFLKSSQKKIKCVLSHQEVLYGYRVHCATHSIPVDEKIVQLLQTNSHRSQSGVTVFALVTSPTPNGQQFSCKFDCKFCSKRPGQPRSYDEREPAVSRANRWNFDPVDQIRDRAFSYISTGHPIDKMEVIVIGGTWSSYPLDYQLDFITSIYYAANTFYDSQVRANLRQMMSLEEEKTINKTSVLRVIGLTLETRPDCINYEELHRYRKYGVTRIQMGIQQIDDRLLERINRMHTVEHTIRAIQMLLDCGFKVDGHLMPDLPHPLKIGVNPKKELTADDIDWDYDVYEADKKMFREVFTGTKFRIDQLKIYPLSIVDFSDLKDEYEAGLIRSYAEEKVENAGNYYKKDSKQKFSRIHEMLIYAETLIPESMRLNREVRDIPTEDIIGGTRDSSMRQVIQREMAKRGLKCKDIREREVKKQNISPENAILVVREFEASDGREYFLSFETPDNETLFGFLRLRLSENSGKLLKFNKNGQIREKIVCFEELIDTALIRELHVYGQTTPIGKTNKNGETVQHFGFGTRLVNEAFKIAQNHGYTKIAVISGNGVEEYYKRKFDFVDGENYLIKHLEKNYSVEQSNDQMDDDLLEKQIKFPFVAIFMIIFAIASYLISLMVSV